MSHPFDEFSKSLSEKSVPRRESLRRLGAVLAGAVLSPFSLGTALADPQYRKYRPSAPKGRRAPDPCEAFCRCRNPKQQSKCLAACRACNGNTSRIAGSCGSYVCCSTASCSGVCSDLMSDPNCGACGNNCGASGQTCCGGRCADLKNDVNNCGACGRVCAGATPYCVNGTCSACAAGQTRCGTACVDISTDAANCGACGNVCGAGSICVNGTCSGGVQCYGGQMNCDGVCREIQMDPANCGGCGVACGPGQNCVGGTCTDAEGGGQCPDGGAWCGGACIDVYWDSLNCGACGVICPPQTSCAAGVCEGLCIGCG